MRSPSSSPRRICSSRLAGLLAAAAVAAAAQQSARPVPLSGKAPLAGTVTSSQNAAPGSGVNTLTPAVNATAAFAGSRPSAQPFSGRLSLADAIARGLDYNLGSTQWSNTVRQSAGAVRTARSAFLPTIAGEASGTVQQTDLKAMGFRFNAPLAGPAAGLSFPSVVGPFSYTELQATLSQSLLDLTAWKNYQSSRASLRADQMQLRDARDLVVLGVGGAYLGVIAAQARLEAAHAQLATADAILGESQQRKAVGAVAQLTVDQNQVQAAIQQLQLTTLQNDVDKAKINLARMIGLPPTNRYGLSDDVPFAPPPPETLTGALSRALMQRADLAAAEAQIEAARAALAAAKDERLPSANFNGSYGVIGTTPWDASHGVFTLSGTLRVPLFQGGRVAGDIEQAEAAVSQRQSEQADLRAAIEAQVREAFLDLAAAASQVQVAQANLKVAQEAQDMARERFSAGVINTVELIQAQQQVATAQQDYINSVYAHNVAKLTLARALGDAPASWPRFLPVGPASAR